MVASASQFIRLVITWLQEITHSDHTAALHCSSCCARIVAITVVIVVVIVVEVVVVVLVEHYVL